jgi:hypothetical protein
MRGAINTIPTTGKPEPVTMESLASLPRWVAWREEPDPKRRGKLVKPPYNPHGDGKASPTDPATWGTRAEAEKRAAQLGGKSGVGIMLGHVSGGYVLIGADLDTCLDGFEDPTPWAMDVIQRLGSYTEVSPNDRGVKGFALLPASDLPSVWEALNAGRPEASANRTWPQTAAEGSHPPAIELSIGKRYFTVTGRTKPDWPGELAVVDAATVVDLIRDQIAKAANGHDKTAGAAQGVVRDNSRSGDAARLVVHLRHLGKSDGEIREALIASGYDDPRQVARVLKNVGKGVTPDVTAEQAGDSFDTDGKGAGAMTTSKAGAPHSNLRNALRLMRTDPRLKEMLAYDELRCAVMLMHAVPRGRADPGDASAWVPRPIGDADVLALLEYLQGKGLVSLGSRVAQEAVEVRARENSFHPIREYLDGLHWDGVPRLDSWLTTYLGAEATPYTAAIGSMFLISMVARARRPGCKADYMLVLECGQGIGKSTVCRILAGEWFSDALPDLHRDEVRVSQFLRGKWLIEVAELSAMRLADAEALKAFITRQSEDYLRKYGRSQSYEPRESVLMGTTNPEGANEYLKLQTGARRFWPVPIAFLDAEGLTRDRDQLFAEAAHRYQAGEKWWPTPEFEREHMMPEQEARRESDPWQELIEAYLDAHLNALLADRVTFAQVAGDAMHIPTDRMTVPVQRRISNCMKKAGWVSRRDKAGRWWEPDPKQGL